MCECVGVSAVSVCVGCARWGQWRRTERESTSEMWELQCMGGQGQISNVCILQKRCKNTNNHGTTLGDKYIGYLNCFCLCVPFRRRRQTVRRRSAAARRPTPRRRSASRGACRRCIWRGAECDRHRQSTVEGGWVCVCGVCVGVMGVGVVRNV